MNTYDCHFEKDGLYVHYGEEHNNAYEDSDLLRLLLISEAVIIGSDEDDRQND